MHLTPELLGRERQQLVDSPTHRNSKRSSATVNHYIASLSGALTYACRQLRWIDDNPCFNLIMLKEGPGRDRILTNEEVDKLFKACQENRNKYLYCIVLLAFTTGMRQGEILKLTWEQIDFDNKLAHLTETKNGSPRSVPLVDAVLKDLKILFEVRTPGKKSVFASKTAFGCIDINKLCLSASRLRLPTQVEMLHRTPYNAVQFIEKIPFLHVPTFFGSRKLRLSQRVGIFLSLLSKIPSEKPRSTILQKPLRSLTKVFHSARKEAKVPGALGNITFLTLISSPHIFGENYRYQPKQPS
jgi:integrase